MTRLTDPSDIPDRDDIAATLMISRGLPTIQANTWADFLAGLPWKYIRPVVQIAVNSHHGHPAVVLAAALATSEDDEFKTVAQAHLDRRQAGGS